MATRQEPAPLLTTQQDLAALLPEILPEQGGWSDEQYLWLTEHSNRLIEFTDGYLEVLLEGFAVPVDELLDAS